MGFEHGKEAVSAMGCNNAVPVGCKESRLEVKGTKEMARGAQEWVSGGGPGNELGWIWGLSGRDELNGAKCHDVVNRVDRKMVPQGPPATPIG
jgi:hypothetical protein